MGIVDLAAVQTDQEIKLKAKPPFTGVFCQSLPERSAGSDAQQHAALMQCLESLAVDVAELIGTFPQGTVNICYYDLIVFSHKFSPK